MSDNNKIVKNIVFQIIHVHNGNWKDDNYWQYLDITSACLKAWLVVKFRAINQKQISYMPLCSKNSRKEDWLKVNEYLLKSKGKQTTCIICRLILDFSYNNYSIYLEKCFLELVVQSCQEDKLCANEKDLNVIIGLLNKTKLKSDLEHCFAKICILVKYSSVDKMMIQTDLAILFMESFHTSALQISWMALIC
ncbi:hypothetical protein RO3G_16452 [Rhizopus delemar RA 99-880]|uniref:Uncharacterized protein n=1 Tax=Rhizopus delemar (strain RA 99-880 / ATCC MYA-4621 / FGSC 9543 / NRRL 43880) TaxID=246409 RepID=I1CTG1_RHIO9|nr:hypothetical protein RO3G_16452 [Rhizopus delemar RA 99-880]|eukprot:EIE91741.1 hypothetical protein RO3G_16452 [Rhizopus delemar RA 99-880]